MPIAYIMGGLLAIILNYIPIVWLVNKLFDLGDANPFHTKIVNGPISFLLVYIISSLSIILSRSFAIAMTPKPKTAWRILFGIELLGFLILTMVYEITGENVFGGNLWFEIAEASSIITGAIVCYLWVFQDSSNYE